MTTQTHLELGAHRTSYLIGVHNGLNPDKPLTSWKRSKDKLIDRIHDLRAKVAPSVVPSSVAPSTVTKETVTEEDPACETTTESTGKQSGRTIRAASVALLCLVDHYEDRGIKSGPDNVVKADHGPSARSVGLPYDEIIRRVKAEFPGCETTVACLRWYMVKIRQEEFGYEGLRGPQRRPRVKPSKS